MLLMKGLTSYNAPVCLKARTVFHSSLHHITVKGEKRKEDPYFLFFFLFPKPWISSQSIMNKTQNPHFLVELFFLFEVFFFSDPEFLLNLQWNNQWIDNIGSEIDPLGNEKVQFQLGKFTWVPAFSV